MKLMYSFGKNYEIQDILTKKETKQEKYKTTS